MPLDTSIALQTRPVQLDNPLDVQSKVMTLGQLTGQRQLQDLQIQQVQQAQQQERDYGDALRQGVGADGKLDYGTTLAALARSGNGNGYQALLKQQADAAKSGADLRHTNAQTDELKFRVAKQRLDASGAALNSLLQNPNVTHQDVIQTMVGLVQSGVVTPEQGQQAIQQLPGNPAQLRSFLMQKGLEVMDASKRMDLLTPKFDKIDNGGVIQMGTVDQLTGQFTPGQAIRKVQTPDSVASNATTIRGQNMTDARARDRLAFDKEQAGFANGAGGALTLPGFGKAPPGYMWDATTSPPSLKSIKGGPADSGAKPSAEVQRQLGGVISFDKDLSALEAALKDFNPRDPRDQADTTKRARIQSLSKQAQLSAKEAAALGALSGPDMMLLEGILNDPTSLRGATAGGSGISAQIAEARAGNRRRVESLQQQYGPRVTEGLPANLQPGALAVPPAADWSQAGYKSQAQAVQDARSTILKGADKAAVVQRLEALGIANHGIK